MIHLRVKGHDVVLPERTPIAFDAGIDSLEQFGVGQKFYVEVVVVSRTPISETDTRLLVELCSVDTWEED